MIKKGHSGQENPVNVGSTPAMPIEKKTKHNEREAKEMTIKEHEKLHQIAQEIKDFCYEFDYWDFMAYYEEQQKTDHVDMDGVVEDIVTEISSNPAYFIDYLGRWEEKKADEIAAEIKALMTA